VSVVCWQDKVTASDWSLFQRSPAEYGGEETEVSGQLHVPAAVFPVKELPECWMNHIKAGLEALEKEKSLGLTGSITTIPRSSSP